MKLKNIFAVMTASLLALSMASCSEKQNDALATDTDTETIAAVPAQITSALFISRFDSKAVEIEPDLVSCTLANGTKTQCISITTHPTKASHTLGPWCPRNISDGPDKSGIWLDSGKVYDADGKFISNLAEFYQDSQWQMFDPQTGDVYVTDSKQACLAAARPDVDPTYQNHCVECLPSYFDSELAVTYLIPATPVPLSKPERLSGVGLAFNGVRFDAPAPVHAILGAHTLAPFDDCGGHVNPHAGYHYHAVTDCPPEKNSVDDHAPMIGYALDGYGLHKRLNPDGNEPGDLDECRGHDFAGLGYHYHVNHPGKNQIIGCFQAEPGCVVEGDSDNRNCAATRRGPPPPPQGDRG